MNKTSINLKNCYGIPALTYEFDFTEHDSYVIYAPNGVMKTSFAKTFKDLSERKDSKDSIFPERQTERQIFDETSSPINPENIFVISPYERGYHSQRMSTLLVNHDIKHQYESIYADINEKKTALIKSLKSLSGIKKDDELERTIAYDFTSQYKEFYRAILRMDAEVHDKEDSKFDGVLYSKIFNPKVVDFLSDFDFRGQLTEYITKYNSLLEASTFFKKGVFNHYNAATIAKNLKDNGFFRAEHAVYLNQNGVAKRKLVKDEAELTAIIQKEKDSIINNEDLKKVFDSIDRKLSTNQDLRDFREFLGQNPTILAELENPNALRQNLWIRYCQQHVQQFDDLINSYKSGRERIEEIIELAKSEHTQWLDVIEEFNHRFSVPFELSVDNQDDVILREDAPNIKFTFKDHQGAKAVNEDDLFTVLSNGELRALYLLNIIFDVEARKKNNIETLFIVDDIADSFDYKNKYAIIEYLKDIAKEPIFKQIILTHNFDFYRTVCNRLSINRSCRLATIKTDDSLTFNPEKYQNNPFIYWKKHFHEPDKATLLIASIPFVRNLAEYAGDNDHFLQLTSLLHMKADTLTITIRDIETIFRSVLKDKADLSLPNPEKTVNQLLSETVNSILASDIITMQLEDKIVLAIAIRLKAEQYIIQKIEDDEFVEHITSNATYKLVEKYKEKFPTQLAIIKLLDQVNLMTPENIHLNSFMYEPILDMSNHHLKNLYTQIDDLFDAE